ncbi:hypothetical protein KSP39_PZI019145 [Platanthera zijinensis]|uniref:Protein kinase domain-containing protein n=1 Tax=Platanthera zijinensis TaxID=2320716 RepID=A0AAP0B1V5_9ASPA
MSLNMKSLTQALAKTAAVIEKTVQTTVQEVTGPRPLQDYDLLEQVGSGGPGFVWKLYAARARPSAPSTQYSLVCVWLLDKRALSEARARAGLSRATEDGFLNIIRADSSRLVRIRHPGVVHVVQALDESKNAMAMVTEPLFASAANTIGQLDNIPKIPGELKGMEMGLLEVKHGLLQIAETLDFLHSNARLIHRAIAPENVFITSNGAWKLGGFGFAISMDDASIGSTATHGFRYPEYDTEDSILPIQPSLNYTAPELLRSQSITVESSADIFSFACLAYHLIARKPLLDCHNNVKMYMNSLSYLSTDALLSIPRELVVDIQRMLSMKETSRPSAMELTGSSFFRDDTRLRALCFLDHLLERDNMQKTEFLKALSDMWKDFDARILRYKVLPPLCAELRNMVLQPMILPMVLTIAKSQAKNDFELSTLPALVPVLTSASGETLLLLVKHADLIVDKATQGHLLSHVLPFLVRSYDDNDTRIQEEVLKRTITLGRKLETQIVKQVILPRVHGLALRTTVAAVRVNALQCLGDLIPSLDKQAVLDILQTLQRCTVVDQSAPTLMCTLGVSHSICKHYGLEFTAEHVLPLLFPLLLAQQLSVQQFAKYMLFVKDILRKIEGKRGVTLTEFGTSEAKASPSLSNELHSESYQKLRGPVPAVKKSTSWDEDWGHINAGNSAATDKSASSSISMQSLSGSQSTDHSASSSISMQSLSGSQPTKGTILSTQSTNHLHRQQTASDHPVDVEWPPQKFSSSFASQSLVEGELKQDYGDRNIDDIDPFANWPHRLNDSVASLGSIYIPSGSSVHARNSNAIGLKPYQGTVGINQSNTNSFLMGSSSLASLSSSTGNDSLFFRLGYPNSTSSQLIGQKGSDMGSNFVSTDKGHTTPKLRPPPVTAFVKGRKRNETNSGNNNHLEQASRSSHSIPFSEQPPILDLL